MTVHFPAWLVWLIPVALLVVGIVGGAIAERLDGPRGDWGMPLWGPVGFIAGLIAALVSVIVILAVR